jgi:hypothetical protein
LGFWATGSWNASVVILVGWVAAAAPVHGIADITLGFQIHNGRRAVTGIKGLVDHAAVPDNDSAPRSPVSSR